MGEASVTLVCEGITPARLDRLLDVPTAEVRAAVPSATDEARVELAYTVAHVRLGDVSMLIDAGLGSDLPGGEDRYTEGLEAGLASIGVRPSDVTHVVLTHAHWDHVNGAVTGPDRRPRFPRARYVIGRADLDAARQGTWVHDLCLPVLTALDHAGVLDAVDGDHWLAPGVCLLDAPGESPGHHAVLVESAGESFVHLADLYHHPVEIEHGWVQAGTDPADVGRSRKRVLAEAHRRGAVVAASHGLLPGWCRVVRNGNRYDVAAISD